MFIKTLKIVFFICFFLFVGSSVSAGDACSRVKAEWISKSRGVNLGNGLEDTKGDVWRRYPLDEDFDKIRSLGFNLVRIPVNWAAHSGRARPYEIEPEFLLRVDHVVRLALSKGLLVVLDFHQYIDASRSGDGEYDRFLGIWSNLSTYFKGLPETVFFEVLNEPNGSLDGVRWNKWLADVLPVIRKDNPNRLLIVSGGRWSNVDGLSDLIVPCDFYTVLTFHYYAPFEFTHQGVWWNPKASEWVGRSWPDEMGGALRVDMDFDFVVAWAQKNGFRSVFLGEFGVFQRADQLSRQRWTSAVRVRAEDRGFGWAYWNYRRDFGLLDSYLGGETLNGPLLKSLIK